MVVFFLLRAAGALLMGGLEMINEAANTPEEEAPSSAAPTMPAFIEEEWTQAPDSEDSGMQPTGEVELAIEKTPEQLAGEAIDLTPPPDAPVG